MYQVPSIFLVFFIWDVLSRKDSCVLDFGSIMWNWKTNYSLRPHLLVLRNFPTSLRNDIIALVIFFILFLPFKTILLHVGVCFILRSHVRFFSPTIFRATTPPRVNIWNGYERGCKDLSKVYASCPKTPYITTKKF